MIQTLKEFKTIVLAMYLIDTNVISELRKKSKANPGVRRFFEQSAEREVRLFVSVITIGELRRGVDLIRYHGDKDQANRLESWLQSVVNDYAGRILDFDKIDAQIWGQLRVPHPENAIDKQIAATALRCDLIVVTRNLKDFEETGVALVNPFE